MLLIVWYLLTDEQCCMYGIRNLYWIRLFINALLVCSFMSSLFKLIDMLMV